MNAELDFYKNSLARVANEFGITSPLQLIGRAENNEETYTDILIKVIKEQLAAKDQEIAGLKQSAEGFEDLCQALISLSRN